MVSGISKLKEGLPTALVVDRSGPVSFVWDKVKELATAFFDLLTFLPTIAYHSWKNRKVERTSSSLPPFTTLKVSAESVEQERRAQLRSDLRKVIKGTDEQVQSIFAKYGEKEAGLGRKHPFFLEVCKEKSDNIKALDLGAVIVQGMHQIKFIQQMKKPSSRTMRPQEVKVAFIHYLEEQPRIQKFLSGESDRQTALAWLLTRSSGRKNISLLDSFFGLWRTQVDYIDNS